MPDTTAIAQTVDAATSAAAAGLFTADNAAALLTLTGLEIVLGIDNIVFIAILCGRLPPEQRNRARLMGLSLAMFMRIGLLFSISLIMRLKAELFYVGSVIDHHFTGKDLVLLVGGLFLLVKATLEVHHKIEGEGTDSAHLPGDVHGKGATGVSVAAVKARSVSFKSVLFQILLLDLVFSLDSVITAVGMAKSINIMVAAVVISVLIMLAFSGYVTRLIERYPTLKMLALSFLLLIGFTLVVEGCGKHIEKGYIYFAMAFSLGVELLNIWVRNRSARKVA